MLGTSNGPVKHTVKDNVKCAGLPPTWTPLVEREQRDNCLNMWHDFKERLKTDREFLPKIITGD
jgi:hypothetical protein